MTSYSDNAYVVTDSFYCFEKFLAHTLLYHCCQMPNGKVLGVSLTPVQNRAKVALLPMITQIIDVEVGRTLLSTASGY